MSKTYPDSEECLKSSWYIISIAYLGIGTLSLRFDNHWWVSNRMFEAGQVHSAAHQKRDRNITSRSDLTASLSEECLRNQLIGKVKFSLWESSSVVVCVICFGLTLYLRRYSPRHLFRPIRLASHTHANGLQRTINISENSAAELPDGAGIMCGSLYNSSYSHSDKSRTVNDPSTWRLAHQKFGCTLGIHFFNARHELSHLFSLPWWPCTDRGRSFSESMLPCTFE